MCMHVYTHMYIYTHIHIYVHTAPSNAPAGQKENVLFDLFAVHHRLPPHIQPLTFFLVLPARDHPLQPLESPRVLERQTMPVRDRMRDMNHEL